MSPRWAIADPRWDSRLSLRLLRFGLLGVWSTFAFAWGMDVVHDGTLNKGAITRAGTPYAFWFVVGVAFAVSAVTLIYNLYLFKRRRGRTSD